jgi:hypothetical protein
MQMWRCVTAKVRFKRIFRVQGLLISKSHVNCKCFLLKDIPK